MTGMAAIAFCAAFTSCSKDENLYDPEAARAMEVDQVYQAYSEAFIQTFGQPAANQNWGFGSSFAGTRGQGDNSCGECIKPDMTNYPSETAPAAITAAERAYVKNWFETNPGFTSGLNISNFYVQHVWGLSNKEYNVYYDHYDQNRNPTNYRDDYVDRATMDYFCVGDGTNYTHTLDFNANNDGSGLETVYMKNSSALSFKYHSSWCSEEYKYFKCAEIDVPGVGKGWYVGLCMYGEKYDNGDRKLNYDMKTAEYADDWIVKIVPGEPVPPSDYDVRIMAEDLNAKPEVNYVAGKKEDSDWDFHDVVFDIKFDATGDGATIRLVAAGGVLPLTVAGHEVHEEFGESANNGLYPMINTGAGPTKPYKEFRIESGADKINNGKGIEIKVQRELSDGSKEWFDLPANLGQPAAKFAVPVNTDYCGERQHITEKYPLFGSWVVGDIYVWY